MCRPEKPITTSNVALRELQEWLRDQRGRTGQGYRALSVRAGCHATTLQRAASSEKVPKLQTVLNYARACDASPDEARHLWKRARYEQTRRERKGRSRPAPRPEFIRDFVDLEAALVDLYEKAGSPAFRTMEQRAGRYGLLPRSTAHRIVNKLAMPHNLPQFQAYLKACEVPEGDWPLWESAWARAWRHEKQDDLVTPDAFGPDSSDHDTSPWFVTPEAVRREADEAFELASMPYLQDIQVDGKLYVGAKRATLLRRQVPAQVKQPRDPVYFLRQRKGRLNRRNPSRRPSQLAFPIDEATAGAADVLF
ncbi:helix-turn-helix domain-containing protein [Streptomyces sp. NPDC057101]|uniref:helix-turn-helix domain-containing protein n=1 Tax=Streptomyces sp. NPDC057101 TaxID=3346020 RepID=UPI003633DC5F